MSLLNDASLILVPSAIKTGEVLVQKPLPNKFADETGNYDGNDPQGSANLTFTRASSATRVGPDGLIQRVRTNLLTYSSDFSNAAWIKSVASGSVTAEPSELDPNGNTGTVYRFDATSGNVYQNTQATGVQYTISFYVKSGGAGNDTFRLRIGGFESSVLTATASWVRYTFTQVPAAAVYAIRTDGAGSTNVLISLAQLEQGDIATDYIATTTAAVSVGPVSGLPRLDYLGSTCPRLLLEPQRTNLALWSEQFDNAAWGKGRTTISANTSATLDPSGYNGSDKLVEDSTTGAHRVFSSSSVGVSDSLATTYSVFAKAAERTQIYLRDNDSVGARFNLSTGAVISTEGTATATITNYGNGWYRCTITRVNSTTSGRVSVYLDNGGDSYTGDGTSGVYIFGAQIETSASYATSYIGPTFGAAVTRLADAASKTGISSLIGQTEGTIYWEGTSDGGGASVNLACFNFSTNSVALTRQGNNIVRAIIQQPSGAVNLSSSVVSGKFKAAIAYKNGDSALYVNGVLAQSSSSAISFTSSFTELNLGVGIQYFAAVNKSECAQALLFKTRLTNAKLAELTTL